MIRFQKALGVLGYFMAFIWLFMAPVWRRWLNNTSHNLYSLCTGNFKNVPKAWIIPCEKEYLRAISNYKSNFSETLPALLMDPSRAFWLDRTHLHKRKMYLQFMLFLFQNALIGSHKIVVCHSITVYSAIGHVVT